MQNYGSDISSDIYDYNNTYIASKTNKKFNVPVDMNNNKITIRLGKPTNGDAASLNYFNLNTYIFWTAYFDKF